LITLLALFKATTTSGLPFRGSENTKPRTSHLQLLGEKRCGKGKCSVVFLERMKEGHRGQMNIETVSKAALEKFTRGGVEGVWACLSA